MIADLGTKPLSLRMLLLHLKNSGLFIPVINDGILVSLNNVQVPAARIQRRDDKSSTINKSNSTVKVPINRPVVRLKGK